MGAFILCDRFVEPAPRARCENSIRLKTNLIDRLGRAALRYLFWAGHVTSIKVRGDTDAALLEIELAGGEVEWHNTVRK